MEDGKTCIHLHFSNLEEGSGYLLDIFIDVKMKTAIVYVTMPITFYITGFLLWMLYCT